MSGQTIAAEAKFKTYRKKIENFQILIMVKIIATLTV